MNELRNTVTIEGNYNSVPTSLTSNTSVVNIIEGLTLTKEADKTNWGSGNLMYTITVDNQTDKTYESPTITDVIDTSLVEFVNDSVMVDGVKSTNYNYDEGKHTLTVQLNDVTPSSSSTLTFYVEKKN